MNKYIFGVAVIISVGIGVYLAVSTQSKDETSTTTTVEQVRPTGEQAGSDNSEITVTYDGRQFSPEKIEITAGTKVRFVNNSTTRMWVASDDHPAHTIYPEFDADKGFAANTTYEFIFEKVGEWGYHDHINPSAIGTVVVK